jgi:predicted  nucleic acid-binding Zn-ribbon protein
MYEDFKDMVEDLQLVIPSTFEECFTYELQILYLKNLIDNIEPGGDYQEEIDNINRKLVALQSEVTKLKNDVNNLNPDEVQRKLDAMQTEINGVKTSIQTITQNVTTLTGNVNTNTTDIETLTGEMTNVKNTLNNKQNVLTFDATPTAGSQNPVTSAGIKRALDNIDVGNVQEQLEAIEREQTEQNNKISSNKTEIDSVKEGLAGKQNVLTFDATPTEGSNNPVTSDGIKKAIDNVDVGNVQEQLDAIKTEQTEQNKKISDNKTAIDSVKESVANQETDITALQETTAGHTTAIEGLQTGKQNVLTFDATPTEGSQNPVTSDGIKKAIDASAGGGGGGGGTGETQFKQHTFDSHVIFTITRTDTVAYEPTSTGFVRHTDMSVGSVSFMNSDSVYLPKSGVYSAIVQARVALKRIGYFDTMIPVTLYPNGIGVGGSGAFFTLDINHTLYFVNLVYENKYVIS